MRDRFWVARGEMVEQQIRRRGLHDERVLAVMLTVPRHLFVPAALRQASYDDTPLVIGHGQTISQPYIVALMTSALALAGSETVLEVGTGSGYQAAILSQLATRVHTVELVPQLAARATRLLARLHMNNVTPHVGDGSAGWPGAAPYDAIVVTAAAPALPTPLVEQLHDGGRMVIPVAGDDGYQLLTLVRRDGSRTRRQVLASVAFVPLRGRFGIPR
ncbi:MAG TPA: protein-L-isoaspartate(D-aspartate) O-methyltransferase [Anaerolineales bacterium]|nr:protein-L-isoaspartate(D-aspartate) O-methyltransferase [Anaerolineales bacterium]